MFDFSVINVVIGLVTIFLLYSLFASALQEGIANLFQRRANMLYGGIRSMLSNTPDRQISFWAKLVERTGLGRIRDFLAKKSLNPAERAVVEKNEALMKARRDARICLYRNFYAHPIIKNYGQSTWYSKPSYLNNKNFAAILIDVIKDLEPLNQEIAADFNNVKQALLSHREQIESEVFQILQYHLNESSENLNTFSDRLAGWFKDTMDRVSGWYTRNTHIMLFCIGFCLAVLFNIDAVSISTYLSRDRATAAQLAALGASVSRDRLNSGGDSADSKEVMALTRQNLNQVNTLIGLGWEDFGRHDSQFVKKLASADTRWTYLSAVNRQLYRSHTISDSLFNAHVFYFSVNYILYKLTWKMFLGFLVTAIAIGLGAPFWFDLLNKFVNVRDAGVLPKSVRKSKK
jgi:hypothetical protein